MKNIKKKLFHVLGAKFYNNGFTLIEIILGISLSVLILLSVIYIYNLSYGAYFKTDNHAEISQNGRVILDRLIRELRQTQDIVTELPIDDSDPPNLPNEIMFEDGHNTSEVKYIRYYQDGTDIKRQIIVYYFDNEPDYYVHWYDTDQSGGSPTMATLEDKIIGEYVSDIEFWGEQLININIYLSKNNQSEIIYTAVYGRNL